MEAKKNQDAEKLYAAPLQHWAHLGRDIGCRPHPIPPRDSSIHTNVSIPLPDEDVNLRGDLYIPVLRGPGPFPAIIEVTPYGAQTLAPLGRTYAARGYLFLAVDCRGRYRSQGEWEPLRHDRRDGQAIIAWLNRHELCNGRIGTRGHSYAGYNQLLAAIDTPPCLQAMVVGVAPGDPFHNTPFQGGAYDLNDLFWLLDMSGRTSSETQSVPHADDDEDAQEDDDESEEEDSAEEKEHDRLLDYALAARPFGEIDLRLGIYQPIFREWISHWQMDSYWEERSVLPHCARIKVPTLFISGWWDGNGKGATSFYAALGGSSSPGGTPQRLLMGPWDHDLKAPDCDDLPESEATAIERGACRDSLNDELAWFDHFLMDIPFGPSNQAAVRLFISGVNKWYEFSDWPLREASTTSFYLQVKNGVKTLALSHQEHGSCCRYAFDPLDPTPFAHKDVDGERIPFDNSSVQKDRRDLVLFDSASLTEEWALIGPLSLQLYASADVADFDLTAALFDVYPDGRSIYLSDGIIRARFAESNYTQQKLVPAGERRCYSIDLWHLGHVLRVGHRLRLQIASAAHLRFDVNPCTGGDLAGETAHMKATISLYCGGDWPSRLDVARVRDLSPVKGGGR